MALVPPSQTGLVYQTAGYEAFAVGMGGNVFLVFEPEGM